MFIIIKINKTWIEDTSAYSWWLISKLYIDIEKSEGPTQSRANNAVAYLATNDNVCLYACLGNENRQNI